MPSTTVHIPDQLLIELDKIVKKKGVSRNRFILDACRHALEQDAGQWPSRFFSSDMDPENITMIEEAVSEMESAIVQLRKNRKGTRV